MRGPIQFIIVLLVVYAGIEVGRPWMRNYFLTKTLGNVAQFATKHDDEAVLKEVKNVLIEEGYEDLLMSENISIEKDYDSKAVKLFAEYTDMVTVFGFDLKPVDFSIELEAAEVKSMF